MTHGTSSDGLVGATRCETRHYQPGAYGLRVFSLEDYDGLIYQAAAFLSRFMARFADILQHHSRQDELARVDAEGVSVRVLVGNNDEKRLVVVSNNNSETVETAVTITDIGAEWQARLYPGEEVIGDSSVTELTLAPWSIEAIELVRQ